MEASDTSQQPQDEQVQEERHDPQIPHIREPGDDSPLTAEEVVELSHMLATYRAEVADLRAERANRRAPTQINVPQESLEDRRNARLAEIANHSHYCPGCGALYSYPQQCRGHIERPHAPIEVVSTDELDGDPVNHTAAPSTEAA